MNITTNLLRVLKDQVDFQLYDKRSNNNITIYQYSNMTFNDQTLSNIEIRYFDRNINCYCTNTLESLLGGIHLSNIPYIVYLHTRIPYVTQDLINECINLLNNHEFIYFWNNKNVSMDINEFDNTLEQMSIYII